MMVDADVTERRRAEEERAHLLRRLITAHEEERGRLSREMHDQFGQHLSVLALKIAALKRDCVEHEALREQVELLEALASQLDSDIEFLVWNLRPTALDDLGLVVASSNLAARWAEHVGIKPDLHTRGMDQERLAGELETMLYRVLQEALTNVAKHATAENVSILLERRGGTVSLLVEDDGIGFDAEHVFDTAGKGLGLIGMRERAALVGGKVEIESHPGSGTTIAVRVPVRGGAEADTTFMVQR